MRLAVAVAAFGLMIGAPALAPTEFLPKAQAQAQGNTISLSLEGDVARLVAAEDWEGLERLIRNNSALAGPIAAAAVTAAPAQSEAILGAAFRGAPDQAEEISNQAQRAGVSFETVVAEGVLANVDPSAISPVTAAGGPNPNGGGGDGGPGETGQIIVAPTFGSAGGPGGGGLGSPDGPPGEPSASQTAGSPTKP